MTLTHRTLDRKTRSAFALLFSLLLLAMQLEAGWHSLSHLPSLGDPLRHSLQQPTEACVECALLASAADALASAPSPVLAPLSTFVPVTPLPTTRWAPVSLGYWSRAPPSLA